MMTQEEARTLLVYYPYIDTKDVSPSENKTAIHDALMHAPKCYAFLEPKDPNDEQKDVHTWLIHDMVID
jgi:hypothetical protein